MLLPHALDSSRGGYYPLPPTATYAFRFYRHNDIVLFSQGQVYDGDLVEPAQWGRVAPGLRVFLRLPGGLETAPIVGALVLENRLDDYSSADGSSCVLKLDLHPDRPEGQPPAEGEVVAWHRSQFRTLFVYWEPARGRAPKSAAGC